MEKSAAAGAMLFVVAFAAALVATEGQTLPCNAVVNTLYPCLNFVMGGAGAPPADCCTGIQSLYNHATSTADRQSICSCLKSVANSATQTMITNAANLPSRCGVSIPYKISPTTDCSTVH